MRKNLQMFFEQQPGAEIKEWSEREGLVWLKKEDLPAVLAYFLAQTERPLILTHVVNDERELGHGFVIYIILHWRGDFSLTLSVREIQDEFPSLTPVFPGFNWAEREAKDLFGLTPTGHPDPRPLVLHPGWPKGFYPLRKDRLIKIEEAKENFCPQPLPISVTQGEGVFEIPVGPIHAGIIEPGHFRFHTVGETVLHLDAQLFYTHKGVEKLLEGMDVFEGLKIVERLCGVCTVSHALAYSEAVEKLSGLNPSGRILLWRTVLAELERLYNHIGDIGNICAGVGFALGNANGLQSKERLQRLNAEIFGHRFLRGVIIPGGTKVIPDLTQTQSLKERLTAIADDFDRWISLILQHDEFRQRAMTTGVLKYESVLDLGVTGPAARASGVNIDWRERHAHLFYPELSIQPVVETSGDVWARLLVRVKETRQSFGLVQALLAIAIAQPAVYTSDGTTDQTLPNLQLPPYKFAWGCAESPRGTDVIWLMTDGEGRIFRCRIRSASYANWPAVPLAVLGNIVPDFPLINKSFELCYSCCDR